MDEQGDLSSLLKVAATLREERVASPQSSTLRGPPGRAARGTSCWLEKNCSCSGHILDRDDWGSEMRRSLHVVFSQASLNLTALAAVAEEVSWHLGRRTRYQLQL